MIAETDSRIQYNTQPGDVLAFWLQAGPGRWFRADSGFDAELRWLFFGAYLAAARGDLADWETTPEGALALVLLLDQYPRNAFRGLARAFASDPLALAAARRAIAKGHDDAVPEALRQFYYTPMMHAEDLASQDEGLALQLAAGDAEGVRFARIHRDIIARFGRFPHRNGVLGRLTTPGEQAFLDAGGFAG